MAIKSFLSENGFSVGSIGSTPIDVIDTAGNVTGVSLTSSGGIITANTSIPSLRARDNITGPGGTISVDASYNISWTGRFIVISNGGTASTFSASGYFDINQPAVGTVITGLNGASNVTVVSAGIPLASWHALYYILPIGSGATSVDANFRIVSYTANNLNIPAEWIQICLRNGDNGYVYFPNGVVLLAGNASAYSGQSSANAANTTVKRDASGNFSAGTITATLSGNATTATTAGNVSGTVAIANGGTGQTTATAANTAIGNWGQLEAHGTYQDLNTVPATWGFSFVQGSANAPHGNSGQWYRGRFSLGSGYGIGTAGGSYWLEMAMPRSAGNSYGNMYFRVNESGTVSSWYPVSGITTNSLTAGSYLTGGTFNGSAAVTIAVDATPSNTASKIVARDAGGGFSAGAITATSFGDGYNTYTLAQINRGGGAVELQYNTTASGSNVNIFGNTANRWAWQADTGKLVLGSAADTNLYRGGADILKTDDAFEANSLTAVSSGTTQISINSTGSGSKELVFKNNGTVAGYVWHTGGYVAVGGGNASTSLAVLTSNGNVGIGTVGPSVKLEVYGADQRMKISTSAADAGSLTIGQWDGVTNRIESSNRKLLLTSYSGGISLGASGSEHVQIAMSGALTSTTSTSSPIYYDSANSNFYCDPAGTSSLAGATLSSDPASDRSAITRVWSTSRGENLVTNGSGLMGSNYNFSGFTFDAAQTHGGGGSFLKNVAYGAIWNDEFMPVDIEKTYRLVAWARSGEDGGTNYNASNYQYLGIVPLDIDGNLVEPFDYAKWPGSTDTTLAAPLNTGATTMTLTSAAGWLNAGGAGVYPHQRQMAWYGYTNSKGYTYPNYTYTRNISYYTSSTYQANGMWAAGGISGNVVTLTAPWPGPNIPAGTAVRNTHSGGTYKYITITGAVPNTWTRYEGYIGGIDTGGEQLTNKFPYGTAFAKMVFLINYHGLADNNTRFSDIWFSETSSRNLEGATTNFSGVVTTGAQSFAGDKVFTGNVTSPGFYNSTDSTNRFVQGSLVLRNSAPTVYFRDTDNNSAMIHVNSNILYVLRGSNDTETYTQVNGVWPLEINLTNNNATFGGTVTATQFNGSGAGLSSSTVPIASLVAGDYSSKITSGTYSINVTSADQIDGVAFRNTGSNAGTAADSLEQNGITYVNANISLLGQTDGALFSQAYNSTWQHQIYGDYRTGQIVVRGKNNGTWQSWRTVLDSSNYTSYTGHIGNGTLTLNTSGSGISGSASFTANQSGNTTFTVTSNATVSNTGNTIVLRDASGNFNAGTITANLSGSVTGSVTGSVSGSSRYLAHADGPRNLTDRNPNWTARTAIFDFVGSGTTGTGGNYAGVLTFVPWDGATASTGDASYQLAFGSSAVNGGGVPQLNIRKGIDTTWNSWYRIPLYGTNAGLSGGAIYATQFIDSDSTGYLCDPATTSVFNALINGTSGGTRLHLTSNGDLFSYYSTEATARIAIGRDIGISGGAGIGLGGSSYALIGTNDTAGTNFYIKLAAATSSVTTSPNLALVSSGLSIAGTVTATQFIDGNDTNYYVDPAGVSYVKNLSIGIENGASTFTNNGQLQIGTTGYDYLFSQGTWSSSITAGILANCADNWEFAIHDGGHRVASAFALFGGATNLLRIGRDLGWGVTPVEIAGNLTIKANLIGSANSANLVANTASSYGAWNISGSRGSYGGIYDSYSGVAMMFTSAGDGGFYRESPSGRWYLYHHFANNCLGIGGSGTAAGYAAYVNGNIYTSGFGRIGGGNLYIDGNYGRGIVGLYDSTRLQGVFAMGDSYKLADDGLSAGTLYGIAWSHPNAGGVAANLNTHGALVMENGGFLAAISGSIRCRDDMRAPLFYDSSNTTYYVDPGSTADTAVRIRGGAVYGPNTTWGAYLLVGGDGRNNYTDNTATASVCATNGNLHLDAASTFNTYINWYDGTDLIVGAGGGNIVRLRVYGSSNYTEMSGSARAPLFYDVDDTAYYIDPTSGQANSEGGKIKWNFTVNGEGATSGRGLALYPSYTSSVPTYGITFAQTAYLGTHGNVTGDWATYFTMNSTANRGWVFRVVDGTPANVASISSAGRMRIASLGVGTDASVTDGEIRATNNITAYYSDERLKTKLGPIQDPIEKVKSLSGFYFAPNDTAMALGYQKTIDVGVSAQEVNAILPEIIAPAPIDPQYMTVRYEKLIPLLIEAIKAQQSQIEELQKKISELQPNK